MFEKFNHLASSAAIDVSRRRFLGRLGQTALGVAGGLAALLLSANHASAQPIRHVTCVYTCPDGSYVQTFKNQCNNCAQKVKSGRMVCVLSSCEALSSF